MKIVKAATEDAVRIKLLIDTNFDVVIAKHHSKEVVRSLSAKTAWTAFEIS